MKTFTPKKKRTRLTLPRETVRVLKTPELEQVQGALPPRLDTCDMGPASCNPTN